MAEKWGRGRDPCPGIPLGAWGPGLGDPSEGESRTQSGPDRSESVGNALLLEDAAQPTTRHQTEWWGLLGLLSRTWKLWEDFVGITGVSGQARRGHRRAVGPR